MVDDIIDNQKVSLIFSHFYKKYGNSSSYACKDINLEIKGGMIFGFLGPNGAGKSTCIKSAIGLQEITEGHILICDKDIKENENEAKMLIGYVPDHYRLYENLTGNEYLDFISKIYKIPKDVKDERVHKYASALELEQALNKKIDTYSHGMKQKITMIGSLLSNPKVWILDEPLTGLDPQSIYQVKELMREHAKEGNIVFFSSHIIDIVEKLCTDIAIINKGEIILVQDLPAIEKEHKEGLENFYIGLIRKENE